MPTNILKKYSYFWIAFTYWLFAGLLPIIVIYFEFNNNNLWWIYSRFYSPLFYYPLIFGGFSVYLSLRPIHLFLSLPQRYRYNKRKRTVILWAIVITLVVFFVEIIGTPAIWEVKPSTLSSEPEWTFIIEHFKSPPATPKRKDFFSREEFLRAKKSVKRDRKTFTTSLISNIKGNSSLTRFAYFLSFYLQSLALFVLYWMITWYSIPRTRQMLLKESDPQARETNGVIRIIRRLLGRRQVAPEETISIEDLTLLFRRNLIQLSMSLSLGMFWLFMRIAFEKDKLKVYGKINSAVPVLGIIFLIALVYITVNLFFVFQEKTQVVINAINFVLGFFAVGSIFQTGNNFLGSQAEPQNYLMCFFAVIGILFPWYLAYSDTLDTLE